MAEQILSEDKKKPNGEWVLSNASKVEAPVPAKDPTSGRFLAGNSGNGGRRPGSRNKVVQALVDIYTASVEEHGAETIELLRQKHPETWARLAMQFVPSKMEATVKQVSVFDEYDLKDQEDFYRAYKLARQMIGSDRPVIDVTPVETPEVEPTDE